MSFHSRSARASVLCRRGGLGRCTLLQLLKTLEGDLELVWVTELGWVVEDVNAQERDGRHSEAEGEVGCEV